MEKLEVVVRVVEEPVGPTMHHLRGVNQRLDAGIDPREDDVVDAVNVTGADSLKDLAQFETTFALVFLGRTFAENFEFADVHRFRGAAQLEREEMRAGIVGRKNVNDRGLQVGCRMGDAENKIKRMVPGGRVELPTKGL